MAIKKTELYRSIWDSCDVLRGSMDASQYKDYILTLLFVKFVSDKQKNDPDNAMIEVPEGCSFDDFILFKGKTDIGERINAAIEAIANAEERLKNSIDIADFNDPNKLGKGKEMVEKLTKLIGIFEGLSLGGQQASDDDLLGDAYEYLMRHFAEQSGKSKGQFYTPAEVSRVLAKIIGIPRDANADTTVYDPTCGSGSLLLKLDGEADEPLSLFGQENDNATTALAKMNMILHNNEFANIHQDNTLAAPFFTTGQALKTFDFVVANPPFSAKEWTSGVNLTDDPFKRFEYGIPPEKNGDYAFLLHILTSMKDSGKAAVILPHGVLFRGNAEADIRRKLINAGLIKAIIGLPANLFYGTGIPACIILMDKETAAERTHIFMMDASKGFMKDGAKNRLREQDIHKIVDVCTKQLSLDKYSRAVSLEEVARNDYNLNIPRYIDTAEPEDIHDLDAHLNGGLPAVDLDALDHYWQYFPELRNTLLHADEQRPRYFHLQVETHALKNTIVEAAEYQQFEQDVMQRFNAWRDQHVNALKELKKDGETTPKQTIYNLSEDLLARFADAPLLDKYDVYQILMDYWAEALQDDVYMLAQEGWSNHYLVRVLDAGTKEKPDVTLGSGKKAQKFKMDFIAPELVIERYFKAEQQAVDDLLIVQENATQALSSYIEEHTVEEGLLADALTDDDKFTKASASQRLKAIKQQTSAKEEIAALTQVIALFNAETKAKKAHKEALEKHLTKVVAQYGKLEELDIKLLMVDKKWMATLEQRVRAEVERVTQQLAQRLTVLNQRYAIPLPTLEEQARIASQCVDGHLEAMGLLWNKGGQHD